MNLYEAPVSLDPKPRHILPVVLVAALTFGTVLWLVMQPVGSECPDMGPNWEAYCPQ